jgi:hypothetical protein
MFSKKIVHVILVTFVLKFTLAAKFLPKTTTVIPQVNSQQSFNYSNASQYIAKVSIGNYYYYQCSPNPCQNGGFCSTNGVTISCSCQAGFSGGNCQFCLFWNFISESNKFF